MKTELAKALLAAQMEAPALQRDGINPHFRNRYVTLETLMESILPVLNKHGIVLIQAPYSEVLVTRFIHAESGEETDSQTPLMLNGKADAQAQGSAITYARRYALMSMLGLVADVDDDGSAAAARTRGDSGRAPRGATGATGPQQREFDPGKHVLTGAIIVSTPEDADALRLAVRDFDDTQDWHAVEEFTLLHLFGKPYEELTGAQKREYYTRLANAVVRVSDQSGGGDFPPPDLAVVEDAWAWAFNGVQIALSAPLPGSEAEAGEPDQPEPEAATEPQDAP